MTDESHISVEAETKDIERFREMIRILQEEGMVPSPRVSHNENPVPDICPLNEKQMGTLQVFGDAMTEERIHTLCKFLDMVTDIGKGSRRTLKWFIIGLLLLGGSFFLITGILVRLKEVLHQFSFLPGVH